jgi:hypothetical protein
VFLKEVTLSAAGPNIDLGSISQDYDDLEVEMDLVHETSFGSVGVMVTLNGDTTDAHYYRTVGYNNSGGAGGGPANSRGNGETNGATYLDLHRFKYPRYSRSDRYKSWLGTSFHATTNFTWGGWKIDSMAPITSMLVSAASGNFAAGSTARLYGLKDVTEAEASGGGGTGDASWTPVTFQNSWGNVGTPWTPAAYRKDGQGFVHVKGVVIGGANNTVMFTLPAGYRPGAQENYPASSSGAYAQVRLGTDGTVYVVIRPATDICMSFTFYAEA